MHIYRINHDYYAPNPRPDNFNSRGGMDYMLDPSWRLRVPNKLEEDSVEVDEWTLRIEYLIYEGYDGEDAKPEDLTLKGSSWSATKTLESHFHRDYLTEQIRVRYASLKYPRDGSRNVVIDSYIPNLLRMSDVSTDVITPDSFPKTACAISPWFASLIGRQAIPVLELCRVLGYSEKDLKTLLHKVKQKDISMIFVGYGGTNVNTIHWLTEISYKLDAPRVFRNITIYEPEDIEISNLLRFPILPANISSERAPSKLGLFSSSNNILSRRIAQLIPSFLTRENLEAPGPNTVIYGAPGLQTRVELSSLGRFISATHGANECSLHLNPAQDTQLQVESYGVIELTGFFMNQLRMAIGLLEVLASDQDLNEQNKELLNYSFDGVTKLKTSKKYCFKLHGTSTIDQEGGPQ